MKKTITLFLVICMFVTLFSGMAFAEEETPEAGEVIAAEASMETEDEAAPAEDEAAPAEDEAAPAEDEAAPAEDEAAPAEDEAAPAEEKEEDRGSDVHRVFHSDFYIPANPEAGIDGRILVDFDAGGTIGKLYLPGKADVSGLFLFWEDDGLTVSKDGVVYESGTAPIAPVGEKVTYKVTKGAALAYVSVRTVQGAADVEPMFLEIDESLGTIDAMNGDGEHETSCYGRVLFDGFDKFMSMKGRGHSTWDFPKKPYNLTLYKKADYDKKDSAQFIPGVKAKKWSLLANYLDNSLIRNKVALDLANQLGIGLESRFVDVWMNGEYLGNYLLTPKKDYQAPDGGFMLENDHIPADADQFQIDGMHDMLLKHNRINVEDIGDDAADQGVDLAYIKNYFNEAFAVLTNTESEEYQNYFDIDSWARMFLMFEFSKTYDCYAGNILMHRDGLTENDKLIAGPAWDYDIAFGRTLHKFLVGVTEPMQLNAEGWYNDSIGVFAVDKPVSILQELGKHASFMQYVSKVYNENVSYFEDLAANVDRQREVLRASALMNNVRWGTQSLCADYLVAPGTMSLLGTGKYALHYEVTFTWDNYVNNLREYAQKRVMWLSDHLCFETPAGEIIKRILPDGTVLLEAALTAGDENASYQWQRSEDGETWKDILLGTGETFCPKTDDPGTTVYRCIVTNAGPEIFTTHGGYVETSAQTILDPATVTVRMQETELEEGELTVVLDGKIVGEYTFEPYRDGWSIRHRNGSYLGVSSARALTLSSQPTVWTLENGVFSAQTYLASTLIGKILTLGAQKTAYLNVVAGAPAYAGEGGAVVTFLKPVAE